MLLSVDKNTERFSDVWFDEQFEIQQANPTPLFCDKKVLLLPSKDLAECVRIIVERQPGRGLGLETESKTALLLQRLCPYSALGHIKIFKSGSPETIADEIVRQLEALLKDD